MTQAAKSIAEDYRNKIQFALLKKKKLCQGLKALSIVFKDRKNPVSCKQKISTSAVSHTAQDRGVTEL